MSELETLLDQLKEQRDQAAYMRDAKNKIIKDAQETEAYKQADEFKQKADEEVTRLESQIKQMALDLHGMAAELPERVTVKMFTVVPEYDKNAARDWCFTNFRPALQLDTKTFEKSVKDGNIPAEIASVTKEARAQIATKL